MRQSSGPYSLCEHKPHIVWTQELKKVCKAKINMLIIDATVLQIAFSNPEIIYQLRVQGLLL